jgi:pimeloyl-ACP methyl ester carboxylesterase
LTWSSLVIAILIVILVAVALTALYFAWATQRIVGEAERLVPPTGKFVEVDGARVHYVETGEGRPIVLIHGLGGSLHHMRRPLMEAFGEGYRLIAMDRPGSGYSTRPRGGATVKEQALFVRRFIETLGLERPLLVGHSLGGAIALRTALDHPDLVAGLALVAPLTHHLNDIPPEFALLSIRSPALRWLVSRTVAAPLSVRNAERVLAFVFGPQRPPEDYAIAGGAMVGLRPSHFVATSEDLIAVHESADDMLPRYGEIAVPVGIIFGDADRVLASRPWPRHGRADRRLGDRDRRRRRPHGAICRHAAHRRLHPADRETGISQLDRPRRSVV